MLKKINFLILGLALSLVCYAQVPESFKYQAVARNSSGEVLANQPVSFRISILEGNASGGVLFSEAHLVSTNGFGLVSVDIGKGSILSGSIAGIDWGSNRHFLKVELDPTGGANFQYMGTSELLSVPYALHAKTVENDMVEDADPDPGNEIQLLSLVGNELTLSRGGGTVDLSSEGDDWGSQVVFTDMSLTGDGTEGSPLSLDDFGATEGQVLKWNGDAWEPFDDAYIDTDADPGNELQTISLDGNDLTLSDGGGTVNLPTGADDWGTQAAITDATLTGDGTTGTPLGLAQQAATSGQVLKWDGGSWVPGEDNSGSGFWQQNASDIYFDSGRVGIGTSSPNLDLTIEKSGHAQQVIKGTMDAILYLDKGSTSRYSTLGFKDQGSDKFWAGLLQSNNFRISTEYGSLNGMEITAGGDANFSGTVNVAENQTISGNLNLSGSQTTGGNATISGNTTVSGKIGIGKTPSAYSLEILGGSLSYAKFYHSGSGTATTDGLLMGTESSNTAWFWNYENGHMRFGTNNHDRLIITSDGRVGIGTTGPSFKLDVAGQLNLNKGIANDQALYVNGDEAIWYNGTYFSWGYGATFNYFADPVGIKTNTLGTYELIVNGQAAKTGGGVWSNYSDIRLKDITGEYGRGLDEITRLRPVTFRYKEGNSLGLDCESDQIGFIAQEVQEVFPEAVNEASDGYLDFNMHSVNVALVNAVKELKRENDDLKARIEKLEKAITNNN